MCTVLHQTRLVNHNTSSGYRYDTCARSSISSEWGHVFPSSVLTKAVRLDRRGRRTSIGPFFTRSRLPEASRRMKNRALAFWIDEAAGAALEHVRGPAERA